MTAGTHVIDFLRRQPEIQELVSDRVYWGEWPTSQKLKTRRVAPHIRVYDRGGATKTMYTRYASHRIDLYSVATVNTDALELDETSYRLLDKIAQDQLPLLSVAGGGPFMVRPDETDRQWMLIRSYEVFFIES